MSLCPLLICSPADYEFMNGVPFRTAPVADITAHTVDRSHRRYGLTAPNAAVTRAWSLLVNSSYAQDLSVQDGTGVPHLPGSDTETFWEADRRTPRPVLCSTYSAWLALAAAAEAVDTTREPFRYDLVNTGREILARLSTPMSLNFTDVTLHAKGPLDAARISATGDAYVGLLLDLDSLVGSDTAFLLGPVVASARAWAGNASDCAVAFDPGFACADFYEWNARVQVTTWNPTPPGAPAIPDGPIDYGAFKLVFFSFSAAFQCSY